MRRLSPWEQWWAACVLASLLVHLLLLWELDLWLNAQKAESRIAAQLEPPNQRPFRLKKWLALPPGKHAFAGRPSFAVSPRALKGLSPGTVQEYLERGVAEGMDTQVAPTDLYSSYQGTDPLFTHPEWEQSALRAWRDSLVLALKNGEEWEGPQPLDPFEVESLARGQGRAVVVVDSTGQLVRGYCSIPIYGIYVAERAALYAGQQAELLGHGRMPPAPLHQYDELSTAHWVIRNKYADFFYVIKKEFQKLSETTPLRLQLDDHYRVEADSTRTIPPDPIHRQGMWPYRDVLTLEQLRQYPVVSLELIDVESTAVLAQYVLEGGFAVMDQQQLNRLEAELNSRAELHVRQVDIAPEHPLMNAYYALAGYRIRGLEVNGRLAAIIQPAGQLLVNAIAYALMQPGSLAERFVEQ